MDFEDGLFVFLKRLNNVHLYCENDHYDVIQWRGFYWLIQLA